ncbi:hypothetical protein LEFCBN_LEFCBN_06510, partial [Dysosmobacter welbionis]
PAVCFQSRWRHRTAASRRTGTISNLSRSDVSFGVTLPFFVFPDSMRRAGHENRQAGWRMRVFRIQTHSSRAGLSNRTWSFYHRSL